MNLTAAEQRPVGQRSDDELAERDEHEYGDEQQGRPDEEPAPHLPRALRSHDPPSSELQVDAHSLAMSFIFWRAFGDCAVDVAVENSPLQHVDPGTGVGVDHVGEMIDPRDVADADRLRGDDDARVGGEVLVVGERRP